MPEGQIVTDIEKHTNRTMVLVENPEAILTQLDDWSAEAKEILELAQVVPELIEDNRDADDAGLIAKKAKGLVNRIEAQRKAWQEPMRSLITEMNRSFDKIKKSLTSTEKSMKARAEKFVMDRERERERLAKIEADRIAEEVRQAEQLRLASAAEDDSIEEVAPPPAEPEARAEPVAPPIVETLENFSFRVVRGWRLVDISMVPAQYLVVNEKVINALSKNPGGTIIPGIEWTETKKATLK